MNDDEDGVTRQTHLDQCKRFAFLILCFSPQDLSTSCLSVYSWQTSHTGNLASILIRSNCFVQKTVLTRRKEEVLVLSLSSGSFVFDTCFSHSNISLQECEILSPGLQSLLGCIRIREEEETVSREEDENLSMTDFVVI